MRSLNKNEERINKPIVLSTDMNISDIFKVDYIDEGLGLMNDARNLVLCDDTAWGHDIAVLVFVRRGQLNLNIDGEYMQVGTHQMLLCRPGRIISHLQCSDDFQGHAVFLTIRFSQSIMAMAGNIWNYVLSIDSCPIFDMSDSLKPILISYHRLLLEEVKNKNNIFYREVVSSLLRCMLCTMISEMRQMSYPKPRPKLINEGKTSPQSLTLFSRFVDILTKEQCTERQLNYYADRLCVTPKYLSMVCKRMSGRTAHQWIKETISNNIYNYLKLSDKSIKEISYLFRFPNLGFFSRYVKENLGKRPTEFRKEK